MMLIQIYFYITDIISVVKYKQLSTYYGLSVHPKIQMLKPYRPMLWN